MIGRSEQKATEMANHGMNDEVAPNPVPISGIHQHAISCCLELLNQYTSGTAIYILSCLCPEGMDVILELIELDLDAPHRHQRREGIAPYIRCSSYENLLSRFQAYIRMVPPRDYLHFWLELTRRWLLTCPLDSNYDQGPGSGGDLFCRRLHTELIESILRID